MPMLLGFTFFNGSNICLARWRHHTGNKYGDWKAETAARTTQQLDTLSYNVDPK